MTDSDFGKTNTKFAIKISEDGRESFVRGFIAGEPILTARINTVRDFITVKEIEDVKRWCKANGATFRIHEVGI